MANTKQPKCEFLSLLPELRLHIYEATCSNLDATPRVRLEVFDHAYNGLPGFEHANIIEPQMVPFLQTCRTVHREFMAHRLRKADFDILITDGDEEPMARLWRSMGMIKDMMLWPYLRTLEMTIFVSTGMGPLPSSERLLERVRTMVCIINTRMRLRLLCIRVTWHYGYPQCLNDVVRELSNIKTIKQIGDVNETGVEDIVVAVDGDADDDEAGRMRDVLENAIRA